MNVEKHDLLESSARAVPPRSHKKSKTGCRTCKKRKIKVSEWQTSNAHLKALDCPVNRKILAYSSASSLALSLSPSMKRSANSFSVMKLVRYVPIVEYIFREPDRAVIIMLNSHGNFSQ
jgi:hypothetical protein